VIIEEYSPRLRLGEYLTIIRLPVNIHRDEVEVNIHRNPWAWGE
jgi:hypothetical protein